MSAAAADGDAVEAGDYCQQCRVQWWKAGRHRLPSLESAVNFAFRLASSSQPNSDTLCRRAASSLLVKEQELLLLLPLLQCDNVPRPADADIRCILAIFG